MTLTFCLRSLNHSGPRAIAAAVRCSAVPFINKAHASAAIDAAAAICSSGLKPLCTCCCCCCWVRSAPALRFSEKYGWACRISAAVNHNTVSSSENHCPCLHQCTEHTEHTGRCSADSNLMHSCCCCCCCRRIVAVAVKTSYKSRQYCRKIA